MVVAEYTLGRWERQWWDLVVDAVTVSLQKRAEVRESAFFQVHTVRPMPGHHLPVYTHKIISIDIGMLKSELEERRKTEHDKKASTN